MSKGRRLAAHESGIRQVYFRLYGSELTKLKPSRPDCAAEALSDAELLRVYEIVRAEMRRRVDVSSPSGLVSY